MTPNPNLDIAWVLIASALVLLMQAGFLCLEAGATRSKNSINVAIKNLSDFAVATLLFAIFGFSLMATMVLWKITEWQSHWTVYLLFGLAVLCPILSLVAPIANKPIYLALMIVAIPIGLVVSAVVLRLIYYGLFTPMALWFKMKGRDAMNRRLDPEAKTYWKDHRDQTRPRAPASYLRLY